MCLCVRQVADTLRQAGSSVYLGHFLVPSSKFGRLCSHIVDLPYLFGNWGGEIVPHKQFKAREHDLLSQAVQQAWTTFAATDRSSVSSDKEWPTLPGGKSAEKLMAMQFELPFRGRLDACRIKYDCPTLWKIVEGNRDPHFVWHVALDNRPLFTGVPHPKCEGPKPNDHHLLDSIKRCWQGMTWNYEVEPVKR